MAKKILLISLLFSTILFCKALYAQENYLIKSAAAPTITNSPVFLAKELGFFEEQGLNVEIYPGKTAGASQIMLLASGQLDTGSGGFSSGLWNAINSGEKIKLVACKSYIGPKSSTWGLLVRKDLVDSGRYQTFKDLKGFKMTLPALGGSGPEIIFDAFLKAGKVTYDDVEIIKMQYGEVDIAFEKKLIDATAQNEPYATKSILDGNAVKVADASQFIPNYQGAAIFYSPKFTEEHPDLAEKWMVAYLKGVRAYTDAFFKGINKQQIIDKLKKYINIEDNNVWEQMTPALINPNGYLKTESISANLDWYVEKGYITKKPGINEMVDNSYVDKALEKLGKYEE